MPASSVHGLSRWNWDGQHVIHDCTVPTTRPVIGKTRRFAVDIRQFVSPEANSVLKRVLAAELRAHLRASPGAYDQLVSREAGSFDMRADAICQWVGTHIRYQRVSGSDPWQLPEETLATRRGDCEDRAFLIAGLLLASGVSGYHVRVALGQVVTSGGHAHDHAWVMYKSEAGRWKLIEPLLPVVPKHKRTRGKRRTPRHPHGTESVQYVPHYLFNDAHLWATPAHDESLRGKLGRRWNKLHPRFAGAVHKSILHLALDGVAPQAVLAQLDRRFSPAVWLFGPLVDASDRGTYNPLDHFDNGYIDQSWRLVDDRLAQYRKSQDLAALAQALHGVADFYAHSSYLHFANVSLAGPDGLGAHATPYHPACGLSQLPAAPSYDAGTSFDLTSNRFSVNPKLWKQTKQAAAAQWRGKLITGRYGQKGDSHGDALHQWFIEGPAKIPAGLETPLIGSLPHHNEIAVDDRAPDSGHRLYGPETYAMQFNFRRSTAAAHIRKIYRTGTLA